MSELFPDSIDRRKLFDSKVRKLFIQLTVGCGQEICKEMWCRGSMPAPRFSPEVCGILAVQLASRVDPVLCLLISTESINAADLNLSPFGTPRHSRQNSTSSVAGHVREKSSSSLVPIIGASSIGAPIIGAPILGDTILAVPTTDAGHTRQNSSSSLASLSLNPSPVRERSFSALPPRRDPLPSSARLGLHSRQSSSNFITTESIKDLESLQKPFLNSLFSVPSFSAIFGGDPANSPPVLKKSASVSLIRTIDQLDIPRSRSQSSLKLVQKQSTVILKYLTVELLEAAIDAYGVTKDPSFLVDSFSTVFASFTSMSQSFLVKVDKVNVVLDIQGVCISFNLISKTLPQAIFQKVISHALASLVLKLYYAVVSTKKTPDDEFLRVLMICTFSVDGSLSRKLSQVYGKLRSRSASVIIKWFTELTPECFIQVLECFKKVVGTGRVSEEVIGAVKTLSMLSHANDITKAVPISAFYLYELQKLNFKEEFKNWKKARASEFNLFNFPFLFDPVQKTRIMRVESMVKMSEMYEKAYVNQALVVHASRFLEGGSESNSLNLEKWKDSTNPFVVLELRRSFLVADVIQQLEIKRKELKKPLKIMFVGGGEEGMDQGGVQKEFFQVILADLLDPSFGLFENDQETRFSWINRNSMAKSQFGIVGTILGLAIYNGVIVRVSFPSMIYKKLLNEEITLEDFEIAFPTLGNGLKQLLEWADGDVEEVFCRTFEISYEGTAGVVQTLPLVPDGNQVMVNTLNRQDYVKFFIKHYVDTSVKDNFKAFQEGFYSVCGGKALEMCRASELELLLCGTSLNELEFKKLEVGATYDDGFSRSHTVIKWFWEVVHQMDITHKKLLLEFVTASDRVPLNGLDSLVFVIQRNGPDTGRLPTALTCFGRLLLPEYSSREKLSERLMTAIENAKGFGLV